MLNIIVTRTFIWQVHPNTFRAIYAVNITLKSVFFILVSSLSLFKLSDHLKYLILLKMFAPMSTKRTTTSLLWSLNKQTNKTKNTNKNTKKSWQGGLGQTQKSSLNKSVNRTPLDNFISNGNSNINKQKPWMIRFHSNVGMNRLRTALPLFQFKRRDSTRSTLKILFHSSRKGIII